LIQIRGDGRQCGESYRDPDPDPDPGELCDPGGEQSPPATLKGKPYSVGGGKIFATTDFGGRDPAQTPKHTQCGEIC